VHEAYLRLRGVRDMQLVNRAHFYGAAAQVMRRVLVDHARRRGAGKRNRGDAAALTANLEAPVDPSLDLFALSEALDQLQGIAPEKAKVVELRYFGGLSVEETAAYLGIAPITVKRYFAFARAWLYRALAAEPS
jgi:RNA polymerase sigma factor (TIGR02999 family)